MSLTTVQHRYLAEMMQKVSRSFALVAPAVETPLDDYLAAAYLICRVADNIEDAQQSYSWQQARFAEFMGLLKEPEMAGLRKACLTMMLPAFETMFLAAKNMSRLFTAQHAYKVSRITMAECVLKANEIAKDDTAIRGYAAQKIGQIEQVMM